MSLHNITLKEDKKMPRVVEQKLMLCYSFWVVLSSLCCLSAQLMMFFFSSACKRDWDEDEAGKWGEMGVYGSFLIWFNGVL